MAKNIEIKAKVVDFNRVRAVAESLSDTQVELIEQHDTFFNAPSVRLKLREFNGESGQLIAYKRGDSEQPTASDYEIYSTADNQSIKNVLSMALGVRGEVIKTRHLFIIGRTRVHLDDVVGLGTFIELEVVLADTDLEIDGVAEAKKLMKSLGISDNDLIHCAYIDLILQAKADN